MFLAVQCGKQMLDTQFQNSSRPFFAITPKILIWINRKISDITKAHEDWVFYCWFYFLKLSLLFTVVGLQNMGVLFGTVLK